MSNKKKVAETKALALRAVALTSRQQAILSAETPEVFIKSRVGRGGKVLRYVEGGYVSTKLNEAFGSINWSWEILEKGETVRKLGKSTEGEVWVRGRLTVHDHVNGYKVFKDAYGQHTIYEGVPYGDALKAASTDAMKKAAAQGFGVAMDVYWQSPEEDAPAGDKAKKPATVVVNKADELQRAAKAKAVILKTEDMTTLQQLQIRVKQSVLYSTGIKNQLLATINEKIEVIKRTNEA